MIDNFKNEEKRPLYAKDADTMITLYSAGKLSKYNTL